MLKIIAVIATGVLVAYSRGGFGAELPAGSFADQSSIILAEPSLAQDGARHGSLSLAPFGWSAPSD
jgi:hypothetical protein